MEAASTKVCIGSFAVIAGEWSFEPLGAYKCVDGGLLGPTCWG